MNQIEGVISVKDVFAELVRKFWLIIICAVVFAAALGGYKLVSNLQAQTNTEEVAGELTEEEIEAVEDYVAKAKERDELDAYIKDSILLDLNPYNVYRAELQYLIADVEDASDLPTIRAAYADYALFGRLACDIADEYGVYEELALKDIIETDGDIREQDASYRTVRIMVMAKDEAQLEELTGCVKEQIKKYSKELNDTIASHQLTLIDENSFHFFKTDLVGKKDYYKEQLETAETEAEMLEDQLNSVQLGYALELLGEESDDAEGNDDAAKPQIGIKSVIKFAILGGVLGVAGSVVLIIALYFFTSQIKNEKETEVIYGIAHLGNAVIYKGKRFEKLADKLFYKGKTIDPDAGIEDIVNKTAAMCKEEGIEEITFLSVKEEKAEQALHKIVNKLKERHIVANTQEWEKDKKLPQHMILVEQIKKTTGEDVKDVVNSSEENQLSIHGYITFSK